MTQSRIAAIRAGLNEALTEIEDCLHGAARALSDSAGRSADMLDQATVEVDLKLDLMLRERQTRRAAEIRRALGRMDHGDYGICEECGREIPMARLLAEPATTLCVQCREDFESGAGLALAR